MSLLSTSAPRQTGSICLQCSIARKQFSSAAIRQTIPPESPQFLHVPRPPQQYAPKERRIKGILPVPKNVFPSGSEEKASPLYLEAVTKEPLARKQLTGADGERLSWKQRMADSRRRNLREGILEMHHRKSREEASRRRRAVAVRARTQKLRAEPEREDERLTRPSVSEVLRDIYKQSHRYDPNEGIEERRVLVQEREALKSEARKDAIHTLYMHARHFITTEEQLDEAVEKAFTTESGAPKDQSRWEDDQLMTTTDMLGLSQGASKMARDKVAAERMKKVAEELTGGKI